MAVKEVGNITSEPQVDSLRVQRADDSTKFADLEVSPNHNLLVKEADNLIVQGNDTHTFIAVQNTSNQVDSAVTSPTSGLTFGVNGATGYILNRYAGELIIGTTNQEAIRISTTENATFVANLACDGAATLGDAAADNHVVNGTLRLASEHSSGPSAPADGDGGILYCKDDGKLYFVSEDVTETDLTGGGGGYTLETKTASFTAALEYIYVITGAAAVTVTLPDAGAAGSSGKSIKFKCTNAATNAVTFSRNSGDSIDGVAVDLVVTTNNYAFELVSDGSNWQIF